MPFKLYDLKPVLVKKHTEKKSVEDSTYTKHKKERDKKTIIPKTILSIFVIFIALFLGTRLMNAKTTKIFIWPQTKAIDSEVNISAKKDLASIDFENKIVSAKLLEKEFVVSKEFSASNSLSATKSSGTIRITSKYSKPVNLIANTRFLSSSSPTKMFLAKKAFTVPANGTVNVEVIASEAGADYNIDVCVFSIPGLRNFFPTQLYSSVTGKSLAKMAGGSTGEKKIISQDDLDKAKEELKLQAEDDGVKELKVMAGEEYIVLDKTIETEIKEASPVNALVGEEKETFIYQLKMNGKILAIKKSDLVSVIDKYILAQQFADLDIKEGSVGIKNIDSVVDAEQNIALTISFSIETYPSLDLVSIKEVAKGQKPANIKKYILEIYPEMQVEPKVKLSPFFVGRASTAIESLEVVLKFD
jgi:hypothetical protein